MKNLSTILFACAIALPLAACGDDDGGTPAVDANTSTIDAAATIDAMNVGPIDVDLGITGTLMDRAGRPGISTVLLGCGACGTLEPARNAFKTTFSTSTPAEAAADTALVAEQNNAISVLVGLGTPITYKTVLLDVATLQAVLVGLDVLKIDPTGTVAATYLDVDVGVADAFGGRALGDDIVDLSLTALTGAAITTDQVAQGARTFNATFPYLNTPWPAP